MRVFFKNEFIYFPIFSEVLPGNKMGVFQTKVRHAPRSNSSAYFNWMDKNHERNFGINRTNKMTVAAESRLKTRGAQIPIDGLAFLMPFFLLMIKFNIQLKDTPMT